MSYEENITGFNAGFNGSREFPINNLGDIQFSQIFNGVPQLYAGSSFTVEEVIEFGVLINIPEAISVDFRWYPPKKYMGTWTLFDQVSAFGTYPEDRGFIEDFTTKVRRYSTYVIQANANVPIAMHEQSAIDDCNFSLVSVEVGLPPIQVQGSGLYDHVAVLKSRDTLSKVPLSDRPFIGRIKTIGLYIDLGCELTFINYKARIINGISVDLPAFPLTVCSAGDPIQSYDCAAEFQTYMQSNYGPYIGTAIFFSLGDAQAYATSQNLPTTAYYIDAVNYNCSVSPSYVSTYYEIRYYQP